MNNQEIECRFLEIDKDDLIKKLVALGAEDEGEVMLEETIMYDTDLVWRTEEKFIRIRSSGDKVMVAYKHHQSYAVDGTLEIELKVDSAEKAELLFEQLGLKAFRRQQKKRHTLKLNGVTFDIDTWPRIPTYVEFEGQSEEELKEAAKLVGYDWNDAVFHNAGWVIEQKYKIPVKLMERYVFEDGE